MGNKLDRRLSVLEAMQSVRIASPSVREVLCRLSDTELAALEELTQRMEGVIAAGEPAHVARGRFAEDAAKLIPEDVMNRPPLTTVGRSGEAQR